MSERRSPLVVLLVGLAMVALSPNPAWGDTGDVTRAAGQGPNPNCTAGITRGPDGTTVVPFQDDGTPALAEAQWNFRTNFGGIAVGRGGQLYVAQSDTVRGPIGPAAGYKADPKRPDHKPADEPDGAPATLADVGEIVKLAVDPRAENLYFAEKVNELVPDAASPGVPGNVERARVWHVGLKSGSPIARKVVTTAGPVGGLAVDNTGRVFIGEVGGTVSTASLGGTATNVAGFAPSRISSLAVDPDGTKLFATATDEDKVLLVNLGSGGGVVPFVGALGPGDSGDNGPAPLARVDQPRSVAVGGTGPGGVYFVDQPQGEARVRRVDLETLDIATVVGRGAEGDAQFQDAPDEGLLAVDGAGNVYLANFNKCQVLKVESAAAAVVAPVENPIVPTPPNNTTGIGGTGESNTNSNSGEAATSSNSSNASQGAQTDPGSTAGDPAGAENQAGTFSANTGAENQAASGQGSRGGVNSATTPAQSFQPSGNAGASSSVNAPAGPTPQPPTAPDSGVVSDAGTAPSPPLQPVSVPGSAYTPAAGDPVGNVVGVGAEHPSAARGANRYAMVRSDHDAGVGAAAATTVGGTLVVIFCVMLAVPRITPRAKPRPKGAY